MQSGNFAVRSVAFTGLLEKMRVTSVMQFIAIANVLYFFKLDSFFNFSTEFYLVAEIARAIEFQTILQSTNKIFQEFS